MAMTFLTKLKPEPMGKYSPSTAYGVNSLVMSEDGVAAYISVKDVPAGTPLTNTEYWQVHTDLTEHTETAVQNWLNAHPEVTTTVQDGSISVDKLDAGLKGKIDTIAEPSEINLISIYGELNNGNISAAITEALNRSSRLYIPKGTYAFNVVITKNCVIRLDDGCTISTNNNSPAIKVQNCSFSLIGGNVCAGNADISMDVDKENSRTYVGWNEADPNTQSEHNGIIFIENCKNVTINSVKVPYSKFASTFLVVDSENVEFSNIDAKNILSSCIMVKNRAQNVYVRNCCFSNIYPKKGVSYCYAFATGLISLDTENVIPPDNIIVENCYVYNSEDCAIDTHGATNVLFQNNKIYNCRTAITAYNDNRRVKRPAGWVMKNVTIRNNYCESDKYVLNDLKHPFVFLGASNADKVMAGEKPGGYDTYQNLVLENNVFISPNVGYETSVSTVYTNQAIRHARICNNYLDGCGEVPRGFYFLGTFDCVIENNVLENYTRSGKIFFAHAKCVVKNNRTSVGNGLYNWSTTSNKAVYYKNESYNGLFTFASPCMAMGDLRMTDDGSQVFINTKRGITARSTYTTQTITGTAKDGIVTITQEGFLPIEGMGMTLGSDQYYVSKMIDTTHMKVLKKNGDAIPNSDVEITFTIERSVEKQI